jgi:signal peptidase I
MITSPDQSDRRGKHAAGPAVVSNPVKAVAGVTFRIARIVVTAALMLLMVGFIAGRMWLHVGLSPVLTGSMRPTFAPGDAVVTRTVPTSSLRVGQIAVIVPPGQSAPFALRLTSVHQTGAGVAVTTTGDANPQPDAWHVVISQPQVAVVVTHLPKVGYLLNSVHDPRWRSALLALIGLLTTFLATRTVLAASPAKPRAAQSARS